MVLDTDISTLDRRAAARFRGQHIGFVFQDFNLIPVLTAYDPALASVAASAAAEGYNRPNAMRHYGYLPVIHKELFDVLYFTPALTLIANLDDHSYVLIPELAYTGFDDLELRLRLAFNRGDATTEYGEKPVRSRLELRLRYFF